ncbi:MAG: hypothetical protein JWM47_3386 [Acidimicrobiales bacterium]|nr:hypothetical protein [Acidimicrobiales bacterium]
MTLTMRGFVWRGLAAGAVAGVVWALFLRFVTETQIGFALQFEDAAGLGAGPAEAARFSRSTQHWGGMAGALLYGIVLGLVMALIVAALHHRIASRNEFGRAARVAVATFVALVVIPMLKYPPNPPTVGDPDTVSERTSSFLLLMGASIVLVFVAFFAWQWFSERGIDGARRFGAVGGGLVVLVAAFFVIWPPNPDAVNPPDNEAAPALVVARGAPASVLDRMLATARTNDDGSFRDPADPDQALDLNAVEQGSDLRGTPVAVSTSKLVGHGYTSTVWHFRLLAMAGYALMLAVFATVFGLLADRQPRPEGSAG